MLRNSSDEPSLSSGPLPPLQRRELEGTPALCCPVLPCAAVSRPLQASPTAPNSIPFQVLSVALSGPQCPTGVP